MDATVQSVSPPGQGWQVVTLEHPWTQALHGGSTAHCPLSSHWCEQGTAYKASPNTLSASYLKTTECEESRSNLLFNLRSNVFLII